MDKLIREQILFKINDIDKLFSEYELVFKKIEVETPDLFDMTILGSVLHSFYNGLENIFEIIAKNIDEKVPAGTKTHQELLRQMAIKNEKRREILNEDLYLKLREYATFRHFYRHAYSFQLNWEKMKPLVEKVHFIWNEIRTILINFANLEETLYINSIPGFKDEILRRGNSPDEEFISEDKINL